MAVDGILLVDKEPGCTSFETVTKIKKALGAKKAGHAGTLDKFASGLLIVCINRATAVQDLFMAQFKRYRAKICFGIETDTLDPFGRVVRTGPTCTVTEHDMGRVSARFTGSIDQIPPVFSAIRRNGSRMYKRALKGESVSLEPRKVEIRSIECINREKNCIEIDVVCSKGTYIRSLARDIAGYLGTCGYVQRLRRLSIGRFGVEEACSKDCITRNSIIPLHSALDHYPGFEVTAQQLKSIHNGVPLERCIPIDHPVYSQNGYVRFIHEQKLVALVEAGKTPRYYRVFR